MLTTKQTQMLALIEDLKADTAAEQITASRKGVTSDLGLINHYRLHELMPNKWFDWVTRADAQIMIIGQDWGPYSALYKYVESYEVESQKPGFDYGQFLFSNFSSRTEKFIYKAVEETYCNQFGAFEPAVWDDIIFTMSVLFTRQGKHFRGNHNFDPQQSARHSYPYVARQLEIVKPRIIITLGGMAFDVVKQFYGLNYGKQTVTEVINQLGDGVIQTGDTVIVPNFHPASYTSPAVRMAIWQKLWRWYNVTKHE